MCSRIVPMIWATLLVSLPTALCTGPNFQNTTSSISLSSSFSTFLSTSWSTSISTSSTLSISSHSSTTPTPAITPPPVFCGGCQLVYEVHASVWWPIIYTNYVQTIIYTVEEGSGSTIGSHTEYVNATALSKIDYGVNFNPSSNNLLIQLIRTTSVYKLRDGGAVEYTLLNTLPSAPLTTVIQYNEITMNHTNWGNGYVLSTVYTNASRTGTPATQCVGTYYTINGTTASYLPGLPSSTRYSYTTVVPFVDGYNMSNVVTYGLDLFGTYVASYLNLSAPCTSPVGGGVGTLKVGVTQLTALQTVFAQSQNTPQPTPTPFPSPPPSPSQPPPPPTPSPTPPPLNPPPSNPPPSSLPSSNPSPSNPPPPNPPPSNPASSNQPPTNPSPSNLPSTNPPSSNPPSSNPPLSNPEQLPVSPKDTPVSSPGSGKPIIITPTSTTTLVSVLTDASGKVTTIPIATLDIGPSFTSTLQPTGSSDSKSKDLENPISGVSTTAVKNTPASTKSSSPAAQTTFAEVLGSANTRNFQELIWAGGVGIVCMMLINVLL